MPILDVSWLQRLRAALSCLGRERNTVLTGGSWLHALLTLREAMLQLRWLSSLPTDVVLEVSSRQVRVLNLLYRCKRLLHLYTHQSVLCSVLIVVKAERSTPA